MKPEQINYHNDEEFPDIKLIDFLAHYTFQDDYIEDEEQVNDIQVVEIRYKLYNDYRNKKRMFQFGVDDALYERGIRQTYPSWQTRMETLDEVLPSHLKEMNVVAFWVDFKKGILIIEVDGDHDI